MQTTLKLLTKSQAAFRHQALNLAEDYPTLYFWTVTFYTLHADFEAFQLFSRFLNHLQKVVGKGWGGVRVAELHKEHGVHFHLVVTERLAADLVRRVGRCYGIGRVNVKVVHDVPGAIDYLAKYLTKKGEAPKTKTGRTARRWATFGQVKRRTRVKDMENASDYWLYRVSNNLPWISYRAEILLKRAWLIGEQQFKSCWFCLRRNLWRDAWGLATEKAIATGLGAIVWRDYSLEFQAPF